MVSMGRVGQAPLHLPYPLIKGRLSTEPFWLCVKGVVRIWGEELALVPHPLHQAVCSGYYVKEKETSMLFNPASSIPFIVNGSLLQVSKMGGFSPGKLYSYLEHGEWHFSQHIFNGIKASAPVAEGNASVKIRLHRC